MSKISVLSFIFIALNIVAADDKSDLQPKAHIVAGPTAHHEYDKVQQFMSSMFDDSYTKQTMLQLNSPAFTAVCAALRYYEDQGEFRKLFELQQATRMGGNQLLQNPELAGKLEQPLQDLSKANAKFATLFFRAFEQYKKETTQATKEMDQVVFNHFNGIE